MVSIRQKIALVVGALVVSVVLLELLVPFIVHLEKVTVTYDPVLGFKGRGGVETIWTREVDTPHIVRLNMHGFHDRPRTKARVDDRIRIGFVGDSFVEAYQVPVDSSFCSLAGSQLGDQFETINLGLHGYGLGSHYLFTRDRLSEWDLEVVVLTLFLGNDLHDNHARFASAGVPRFSCDALGVLHHEPPPPRNWLILFRDEVLARSTVARLVWRRVLPSLPAFMQMARSVGFVSTPSVHVASRKVREDLLCVAGHHLTEIRALLSKAGLPIVVLVLPDPYLLNHELRLHEGRPDLLEDRREIRLGLDRLLDAFPTVVRAEKVYKQAVRNGQDVYINKSGHLTLSGHRTTADLIVPALIAAVSKSTGDVPSEGP